MIFSLKLPLLQILHEVVMLRTVKAAIQIIYRKASTDRHSKFY